MAGSGPIAPTGAGDRLGRLRDIGLGVWSALAILFLFIPIVVAIVFSFNDPVGRFNFTWHAFTLDHWAHPFRDPDLAKSMRTSVELAIVSTAASVALGTLLAIALVRHRFRGRAAADFFVFLPMATPEVVMGASLLALFLVMGLNTGFLTLFIAHTMFSLSYVVVTVKSRLEGMDPHIEEAARDLGASEVDGVLAGHAADDRPRRRLRCRARRRAVDRRLRRHVVQRRADDHVPALHLRRDAAGCAGRGQRARHDAPHRDPAPARPQPRRAEDARAPRGAPRGGGSSPRELGAWGRRGCSAAGGQRPPERQRGRERAVRARARAGGVAVGRAGRDRDRSLPICSEFLALTGQGHDGVRWGGKRNPSPQALPCGAIVRYVKRRRSVAVAAGSPNSPQTIDEESSRRQ